MGSNSFGTLEQKMRSKTGTNKTDTTNPGIAIRTLLSLIFVLAGNVGEVVAQESDPNSVMTGVRFEGNTSIVSGVVKGGPADRAGIRVGDEIISVGERFIVQSNDLVAALEGKQAGDVVVLEIRRDSQFRFFDLKLVNTVQGDVTIGEDGKVTRALIKLGILDEMGPELTVNDWWGITDNESVMLADNRDKIVCLMFFQTDCHYSNKNGLPELKQIQESFADDPDVKVLAIQTPFRSFGVNTFGAAKSLFEAKGIQGPMGHEGTERQKSRTYTNYKVPGTPWFVVMDKKGVVRYNDSSLPIAEAKTMFESLKSGIAIPPPGQNDLQQEKGKQ